MPVFRKAARILWGLALELTGKATKYYKDDELN